MSSYRSTAIRIPALASLLASLAAGGPSVEVTLDRETGTIAGIETLLEGARQQWLDAPLRAQLRNEVTGAVVERKSAPLAWRERIWRETEPAAGNAVAWEFSFESDAPRVGHELVLELPILNPERRIFTPTEYGVMSVATHPDFTATPYGANAWDTGRFFCLPLVSVFEPRNDTALTIGVSPRSPIPHLEFSWSGGKTLTLRLAHRAVGGGLPSTLRLLLYGHRADYRAALADFSGGFPEYFLPPLGRGPYEGTFWYHHIHERPPREDLERQQARFIWASFWFTHLGDYLPAAASWHPYTFAKWWKLGEVMDDGKIRSFVKDLHDLGIGTFAYFNVTEFGGAGGKDGSAAEAERLVRERYARDLVKDERGTPIPTWEGAMAVSPRPGSAVFEELEDQWKRHLERLPEIDGFCIDRLDWASMIDYGHDDGITMIGDRPCASLAGPVEAAVAKLAGLAHKAGKRVYVNQFYRLEVVRDVDGYCHENDYARGLGYLSPFRPVSAWHMRRPYQDDLLLFEAQLKLRLQFAVFPQVISRAFPISQQAPDPEAAAMLEQFAPLFAPLRGKTQVLRPHCVSVTGANEANLFESELGLVIPVTSRVHFLARPGGPPEETTVTVMRWPPDGDAAKSAAVIPLEGPPYRAAAVVSGDRMTVTLPRHGAASVVVVSRDESQQGYPSPPGRGQGTGAQGVGRASGSSSESATPVADSAPRPALAGLRDARVLVDGVHAGAGGPTYLFLDGENRGELRSGPNQFTLELPGGTLPDRPLSVRLVTPDEGTWFIVERMELLARGEGDRVHRLADWRCDRDAARGAPEDWGAVLAWREPEVLASSSARFESRQAGAGGRWIGKRGSVAAWIPAVAEQREQNGFSLTVTRGVPFTWSSNTSDERALEDPRRPEGGAPRSSTCWHAIPDVVLAVKPPDEKPYRLSAYLLDHDRNGRALAIRLRGILGVLDTQAAPAVETAAGLWLRWEVAGPVTLEIEKTAGYNAVCSGIFIDG